MFTHASYPIYASGTDVVLREETMDVRVFASGDDMSMWDVEFYGLDGRPHTAPPELAKDILKYIEATDISAWGDITAQSRTNPRLVA